MKHLMLFTVLLFAHSLAFPQLNDTTKPYVLDHAVNTEPLLKSKGKWAVTLSGVGTHSFNKVNGLEIALASSSSTLSVCETIPFSKLNDLRLIGKTLSVYANAIQGSSNPSLVTRAQYTITRVRGANSTVLASKSSNLSIPLALQFSTDDLINNDNVSMCAVFSPEGVSASAIFREFRMYASPENYNPVIINQTETSGWTEWQPTTITAETTNPTKGTTTTDACRKRRNGTQLEIEFVYRQETAGTGGSGVYYFSCGGFALNGESLTPDYDLPNTVNIGGGDGNTGVLFSVVLNPAGRILLFDGVGSVSGTNQSLSNAGKIYRFNASIAIKEWRQSSLSTSSQNDISNPKNHTQFGVRISGGGTKSAQYGQVPINVTNVTNGHNTLGFEGLTSPPSCQLTPVQNAENNTSYSTKWTNGLSSSGGDIRITDASSNLQNVAVQVDCVKTGQDYDDAWKKTATAYLQRKYIADTNERVIVEATSSVTQAVTVAQVVTRIYPTVVTDTHSAYNSTNGIFTSPKSALYSIYCGTEFTGSSGYAQMISTSSNGEQVTAGVSAGNLSLLTPLTTYLSEGQTARCRVYKGTAGTTIGSSLTVANKIRIFEM